MRIKRLFTVAPEEKLTEKRLLQVLVSSVCSMLLCMSCLAGTTWAWFTVSVENHDNEIRIPNSFSQNAGVDEGTTTTDSTNGTTEATTEATTEVATEPTVETTETTTAQTQ